MRSEMMYGLDKERTNKSGNKVWDVVDNLGIKLGELTRSEELNVWSGKSFDNGTKLFVDKDKALLHIIGSRQSQP